MRKYDCNRQEKQIASDRKGKDMKVRISRRQALRAVAVSLMAFCGPNTAQGMLAGEQFGKIVLRVSQ